jgi:hypothetical protein
MSRELDIRQRALAQLRKHSHQILAGGYARMTPAKYSTWEEPDITGDLCEAMTDFMASDAAPSWVIQYALRDDPKLNVDGKRGESRPRIDIEFERVQRGERPIFRFEAKRLGPNHPVSKYIGSEGLGAFLNGYYPLAHPEAGMLGYVQENDVRHWHDKLNAEFQRSHCLELAEPGLQAHSLASALNTWRSVHETKEHPSLTIWHTLLHFC